MKIFTIAFCWRGYDTEEYDMPLAKIAKTSAEALKIMIDTISEICKKEKVKFDMDGIRTYEESWGYTIHADEPYEEIWLEIQIIEHKI